MVGESRKHRQIFHYWRCNQNRSVTGETIAVRGLALKGLILLFIFHLLHSPSDDLLLRVYRSNLNLYLELDLDLGGRPSLGH